MNFLRELNKILEKEMDGYIDGHNVKRLWRSFWKEKIGELKKEIKLFRGINRNDYTILSLRKELLFAEKQLKEARK